MTNNYASMTHGKNHGRVGDKCGKGNVTRNASGVNPFSPRLQPLRNDEVYTREPQIFTTPREKFGILKSRSYIHHVNDDKNR